MGNDAFFCFFFFQGSGQNQQPALIIKTYIYIYSCKKKNLIFSRGVLVSASFKTCLKIIKKVSKILLSSHQRYNLRRFQGGPRQAPSWPPCPKKRVQWSHQASTGPATLCYYETSTAPLYIASRHQPPATAIYIFF